MRKSLAKEKLQEMQLFLHRSFHKREGIRRKSPYPLILTQP
ncbi:hypothetical protein MY7_2831 [Bacillus sp. 5B6]|nr:hypothetical protein MY7_2831 [Bacillus sp. 5B6]